MYLIKLIIKSCILLFLVGCNNKQISESIIFSDLPLTNIPVEFTSTIEIKNWLAIGPFNFNPFLSDPTKPFFHEDLKRYGIKEGSIDENQLKKLQRDNIDMFFIEETSSKINLFTYVHSKMKTKSNIYLITRINSLKEQEATLITDGSNSYAVWFNGNKLFNVVGKHNTNKGGDRFMKIFLKKGENILFVKINKGSNILSWNLICAISPPTEAKKIFQVNYSNDFVINSIINNSLEIYAGPYLTGKVDISDKDEKIIANGSFEHWDTNEKPYFISGLEKIQDGFYKTTLTIGDTKLVEMIYKGNYNKFIKQAKAKIEKMNTELNKEDLDIALRRILFLNEKSVELNSPSEIRQLNRNKVFWGYSLYKIYNRNAVTRLMVYKNEENNRGVFLYHNGCQQQKNIPLIIIIPAALDGDSMIEDWYMSNLDQIETDNSLADYYGFAIAWIYAGGSNYSAQITEKEISAVINRLSRDGSIDNQKIYIMGDCEGGRRALIQLVATPNRYAACAVGSPITLSGGNDGIPINLLSKMPKIPIIIKHGINDDISSVENSRKFYEEVKKLNLPVKYIEDKGSHVSLIKDYHKYVFEFFSQINFSERK